MREESADAPAIDGGFDQRVSNYMRPISGWFGYGSTLVAVVASITTVLLGTRDLFDLTGPGWAKVLAWFAVALVIACLTAVYIEQFRHRRDVARLIKQERLARLEQFKAYQQKSEAEQAEHRVRERELEDRLEEYSRNARVAVALPAIHGAFHNLRDSKYLRETGADRIDWEQELTKSLQCMAHAFSAITGAPCRACIKRLEADENAPTDVDVKDIRFFSVRTLCRDSGVRNQPTDAPSPLHKNTDFAAVWDGGRGRWFLSNDLDHEPGYLNEHRQGDPSKFEYNATIVWPIQKRLNDDDVYLYGFFCIDAVQRNVFVNSTDGELGAAYADALYAAIADVPRLDEPDADPATVESATA